MLLVLLLDRNNCDRNNMKVTLVACFFIFAIRYFHRQPVKSIELWLQNVNEWQSFARNQCKQRGNRLFFFTQWNRDPVSSWCNDSSFFFHLSLMATNFNQIVSVSVSVDLTIFSLSHFPPGKRNNYFPQEDRERPRNEELERKRDTENEYSHKFIDSTWHLTELHLSLQFIKKILVKFTSNIILQNIHRKFSRFS